MIDVNKIISFLERNGWRELQRTNPGIKIFQKEIHSDFVQVTIPIDHDLVDFEPAAIEAIRTIAESEECPAIELALQFCNSRFFRDLLTMIPDSELRSLYRDLLHKQRTGELTQNAWIRYYYAARKDMYGMADPYGTEKDILMEIADRWYNS